MTLCSLTYAQSYDTTLVEVFRSDSVHTPIALYRQDNIQMTIIFNEYLKFKQLDSLNNEEISLHKQKTALIKEERNDARSRLDKKSKAHQKTKTRFKSANIERWGWRILTAIYITSKLY